MRRIYIHTPGWHTIYSITFVFVSVTWWLRRRSGRRRCSRRRCCRFWWRCAVSFAPPVCLRIRCSAILAWKAAIHVIFINHCWVSFHRSFHLFMPRDPNSSLLHFSDFGTKSSNQLLSLLHCSVPNPPLAILAIFKARRMSDCSGCT